MNYASCMSDRKTTDSNNDSRYERPLMEDMPNLKDELREDERWEGA